MRSSLPIATLYCFVDCSAARCRPGPATVTLSPKRLHAWRAVGTRTRPATPINRSFSCSNVYIERNLARATRSLAKSSRIHAPVARRLVEKHGLESKRKHAELIPVRRWLERRFDRLRFDRVTTVRRPTMKEKLTFLQQLSSRMAVEWQSSRNQIEIESQL